MFLPYHTYCHKVLYIRLQQLNYWPFNHLWHLSLGVSFKFVRHIFSVKRVEFVCLLRQFFVFCFFFLAGKNFNQVNSWGNTCVFVWMNCCKWFWLHSKDVGHLLWYFISGWAICRNVFCLKKNVLKTICMLFMLKKNFITLFK